MFDYRNLNVWWRAKEMVRAVYELTAGYPPSERYGLTAQSRRAVVSIAANLAEGAGRRGSAEFARFVDIATGSAYELECHLLLAHDLRMIGDDERDFEDAISVRTQARHFEVDPDQPIGILRHGSAGRKMTQSI